MPIITAEEKAQKRLEVKARSTLMMSITNEHQLKFSSIKDAKQLLEAVEKRFDRNAARKKIQRNLLKHKPNSPQLVHKDLEQIHPDDIEEMDLRCQMAMLTMRAKGHFARMCRAPRNQDNKHKESTKRSVPMETPAFTALVSCDGHGGYDWSDRAEEGPTMHSWHTHLQVTKLLSLKSVEERLEFFKKNEFIYLEDINVIKVKIQMKEISIGELRRKLEVAQKEKEGIQLKVVKFKNASKSLNKVIDCQIVDNCKKRLGFESHNAIPPPYTGNFMPPKPDLSFTNLDEFIDKPEVEKSHAKSSKKEPKFVRMNNDASIIEEWVSGDEEENVCQPRLKRKQLDPALLRNSLSNLDNKKRLQGKLLRKLSIIGKPLIDLEAIKETGII
nr:hypothetical protein [Tanacetum cinerariifolium]